MVLSALAVVASLHMSTLKPYVSGFEKRGHFGPDLNFETLICSENIGNQLSFDTCFMFIAAWIHLLCAFI